MCCPEPGGRCAAPDAMNQAEADGTAVLMGMPFEASLDDREPMFYAMPASDAAQGLSGGRSAHPPAT